MRLLVLLVGWLILDATWVWANLHGHPLGWAGVWEDALLVAVTVAATVPADLATVWLVTRSSRRDHASGPAKNSIS